MNVRLYTVDEVLKNLAVLQPHLENVSNPLAWCMDCIRKHFYETWKLADEGVGFFPEDPKPWQDLGEWTRTSIDLSVNDLNPEDRVRLADEARQLRKGVFMAIALSERRKEQGLPYSDSSCPFCDDISLHAEWLKKGKTKVEEAQKVCVPRIADLQGLDKVQQYLSCMQTEIVGEEKT